MRLLLITLLSILVGCGNDKYQLIETVNSNGLQCTKNDSIPISGTLYDGENEMGNFVNGKPDGIHRSWHKNNQHRGEGIYINGKADGIHREWYLNGQLLSEKIYINGKEDGIRRIYHENGMPYFFGNYINGKADGIHRTYSEDGEILDETYYKDGIWDEAQREDFIEDLETFIE